MSKERKTAIKAAKESGKILMKYYNGKFEIEKKPDNSPVTVADKESEKKIVSTIKKEFQNHNFLGEEFKYDETDSDCRWIIDPLDGTRNFVRKMPFFGNIIALEKNRKIILGVINMPAMRLFAYAEKGKGAFVNGKKVTVSRINDLNNSFVSFGDIGGLRKYHDTSFFNLIRSCYSHRGFGDTIHFLLLALGYVDIVLDSGHAWDLSAPKIIIEEAGGKVTDFKGNSTIYGRNCIATNGILHDEVLKLFNK